MMSAVVIEEEVPIRRALCTSLEKRGFSVHEAATASEGLETVRSLAPDIVLLDLGLPDRDGVEALAALREWSSVPVIILSARKSEHDIVKLLESGADDYIVKPFSMGELVARMNALVRSRNATQANTLFRTGHLAVELVGREVRVSSKTVKLTPTEFDLIRFLIEHAGSTVTHGAILHEVWGQDTLRKINFLHVRIAGLRKKIEKDPHVPAILLTEPGVGYRLVILPYEL
jgi:two-component system KDP operon response regulator KdpE